MRHYRNREIEDKIREGRRLKYGNKNSREKRMSEDRQSSNLNRKGDLIVLNQILLVQTDL